MGTWISYTLTSGIILLCLYLAYNWAMADDNQPRFNRAILLGCYILAAILPLSDFSIKTETAAESGTAEIGSPMIAGVLTANEGTSDSLWPWILAGVYLAGALAVTAMTVIAILRLHRMVSKAEKIPYRRHTIAVVDDKSIAPFSWHRYIVMNRDDYNGYRDLILTHETAHLERYHRLDLMAARFFEIIMWYNPAAWLMTSSLRAVHEFEADRAVIGNIDNPGDYQMLLIKKAVGRSFPVLANSLNHSNLKKRITMMLNPVSRKSRRMRALALAPAAAIALLSVNIPFMARAIDSVAAIDLSVDSKDSEKSSTSQITVVNTPSEDTAKSKATTTVTVNGKTIDNVKYFVNGKQIDDINSISPDSIKNVSVFKDRNEIHIETYRPGEAKPENQASGDTRDVQVIKVSSRKKDDAQTVFSQVEEMPKFPGGDAALMQFLRDNINFPESEIENKGRHTVVVQFVIGEDGSVRDSKIIKGDAEAFNTEALRVVNSLPQYIPGKINGKPVSVYYTLPITFSTKGTKKK